MTRAHKRVRNTFKKQRITWHISCKFVLSLNEQDLYWLSARISMQPRAYKPTSDAARRRAACTQPPSCEFLLFSTTSFSQAAKRTSGRPKLHRPPSPHQPRGARSFFLYIFLRFPLRRIEQQWGRTDPTYRCCLNHRGGRSSHLRRRPEAIPRLANA